MALAERCAGVVINADSMQVYRELSILTARPTAQEEARAPHALYGFVGGAEGYSAGRYASDAAHAIGKARSGGRVPIVVGGTGLYFKALFQGLSPVPAILPEVRAHWRGQALHVPPAELHAILARRDPVTAARLMPSDPQRIVRALEVLDSTGRSLAEWQRILDVNLTSVFLGCRAVVPLMKRAGRGKIVNIASTDGMLGRDLRLYRDSGQSPAVPDYLASKAGVINLTRSLARALAPDIRVNAVAPGFVDSPWNKDWPADRKVASVERTPLKRACTPQDIAETVFFLCAGNSMITGQTVIVDGGLTL